jgi:hypothetical protein
MAETDHPCTRRACASTSSSRANIPGGSFRPMARDIVSIGGAPPCLGEPRQALGALQRCRGSVPRPMLGAGPVHSGARPADRGLGAVQQAREIFAGLGAKPAVADSDALLGRATALSS